MKSLKVALLSHEFPPYMFGGIASNCYDLALALSKRGISTTVFSGRSKSISVEKINRHLKIIRLPCLDFPPRFLWFQLQNFKTLLKLLGDYSIIHGVNPLSSAISIFVKKKLNKPTVTTIHEVYAKDLKAFTGSPLSEWSCGDFLLHVLGYPLNESLVRSCLKASDHIVVCGSSTRRDMLEIYQNLDPQKVSVIYNGINFDKTNAISQNDFFSDASVTFFGRLILRKGILHLVNAVYTLRESFPDLRLHIFGRGPLERKIRKMSADFKMADRIVIHSHVSYEELIRNVKRSMVIALPSLYEVGPFISALEAMACKKPVIAFDFPFTREFISNMSTGLLAKPGDIKDLAEKIALLLSDKSLRQKLANNAYNYVKSNHDWDKLVQGYIKIYQSLLGN
jgi:glycosyltransferase involved in cell wall biosynthesis